jgi:hypothetical protein
MSLLTPLYILGLLAVSLPFVLHLIRRAPRGDFQFSSLMFLSPSPPRLTRRSRLDHILLLLLRGAVLCLLAFAFARPFLRQESEPEATNAERQRVAIVVDTSASMKRGDLWQQAMNVVDEVVAERQPFDQLALYALDDHLRPLITFDDMSQLDPSQRRGMIKERLAANPPGWAGTHLGRGLLDAVEIVSSVAEPEGEVGGAARRIVLVSDLQQGSRIDELSDYQWPADVPLDLKTVSIKQPTNAGVQLLSDGAPTLAAGEATDLRVSVYNDKDSTTDQFKLAWMDGNDRAVGAVVDAYVPAGESRVFRVPLPNGQPPTGERLVLSGDANDFDNTLYFASRPPSEIVVTYIGDDAANDTSGLRYYLERALSDAATRTMTLKVALPGDSLRLETPATTPLVVVAKEPTADQLAAIEKHVDKGGTALWVVQSAEPSQGLGRLLGSENVQLAEAALNDNEYAMLGQIAFDHPLFAPMAAPQFNDFTQIYFRRYRRLTGLGSDANIVAKFENGDPAVIERRVGQGQVVVFTSGWNPADSWLARSWKFVLIVNALIDGRRARLSDRTFFVINEPVPIRDRETRAGELAGVKPDRTKVLVPTDSKTFADTSQPGVYAIQVGDQSESIAVNLDPNESKTSPLAPEALRQYGARLVNSNAVVENEEQRRQLRDVQLESRQKLWQWLIVAAFGMAVAETWLAGRITKQTRTSA